MATKPLVQTFYDELDAVVKKYCDNGLTVSEAIGSLELLKLAIYEASKDTEEEL